MTSHRDSPGASPAHATQQSTPVLTEFQPDAFLPGSVVQKLVQVVSKVMKARRKKPMDALELKGIIIVYVLAASYSTSVGTITSSKNEEFFFQLGIKGCRYMEVWSAFSCTVERRQLVERFGENWRNRPNEGNNLITDL